MQDSMKDYIRITTNTKEEPKIKKENLPTLEHKIKCENYAQRIVLFLIESKHKPDPFMWSLNFIDPENYQDVVEERSVTKLCGYPLCGKRIPDMPNKQYYISTKMNKVFDITERKNFCSNYCYQASCFIKNQIDTSPLWLRKPENFLKYKLMDEQKFLSPGIEIDQGIVKVEEKAFTSVSSFTEACLDEAQQFEKLNEPDFPDFEETDINLKPKSILKSKIKVGSKYKGGESEKTDVNKIAEEIEDKLVIGTGNADKKKHVQFSNLSETEMDAKPSGSKTRSQKEIDDLNDSIAQICKTIKIKLKTNDNFGDVQMKPVQSILEKDLEERTKPIILDNVKIEEAVAKVNSSAKHNQRKPILIETKLNPEVSANREKIMFYMKNTPKDVLIKQDLPKYTKKIIEKIKDPQEDVGAKNVIEKVKKMRSGVSKVDGDLQKVLAKLKSKENKSKSSILITAVKNPEAPKAKKADIKDSLKPNDENIESFKKIYKKWLTIESYIFLHGEDKVKATLNEEKLNDYFENLKIAELETAQQMKYMAICKKMHLKELAEEQFENSMLERSTKPPPDFEQLKSDSKEMTIKVNSYFSGGMYEKEDTNFPSKTEGEEDNPAVLPLADVCSRNAMRKKIFLNSAMKYINQHAKELGLGECEAEDVQYFLETFKLESDNVVFRPRMWSLIAVTFIFVLTVKDEALKSKLRSTEALNYKRALFEQTKDCDAFLSDIVCFFESIDSFVRQFITSDQ